MLRKVSIILLSTILCLSIVSCNHLSNAFKKDGASDTGLERTVTQSDYTGKVLQQFVGRFNVKVTSAGGLVFWFKGKRVYLVGGIISDIEK